MNVRAAFLASVTLALAVVWTAGAGAGRASAAATASGVAHQSLADRYEAVRDGSLVTLTDRVSESSVSIAPSVGNIATAFRVKGQNVLRFPHESYADFESRPAATGIPFMAPWANRLDEQAFYANGRRHDFDMTLGNVRGDVPIHGFVTTTNLWQVTAVAATDREASVTSRLDFYRQPAWMRQWPVRAHHRDHLPPGRRCSRDRDDDQQPE